MVTLEETSAGETTESSSRTGSASQKLVACLMTLHLLAKIRPQLLVDHAITLQPYLSLKCQVSAAFPNIQRRHISAAVPITLCHGSAALPVTQCHVSAALPVTQRHVSAALPITQCHASAALPITQCHVQCYVSAIPILNSQSS